MTIIEILQGIKNWVNEKLPQMSTKDILSTSYYVDEEGIYIKKIDGNVYPISHPDLSTQPSILPQRFGNRKIYEILSRVENVNNYSFSSLDISDYTYLIMSDNINIEVLDNTPSVVDIQEDVTLDTFQKSIAVPGRDPYLLDSISINPRTKKFYFKISNGSYISLNSSSYLRVTTSIGTQPTQIIRGYSACLDYMIAFTSESESPYTNEVCTVDIVKSSYTLLKDLEPSARPILTFAFNDTNCEPVKIGKEDNGDWIIKNELDFTPDFVLCQYRKGDGGYYYTNDSNDTDDESEYDYYSKQYLTFEALEDGTFTFSVNDLQYSLDDGATWTTLAADTASPTISAGNKILWKQTGLTPSSTNPYGIGTFSSTGNFEASGNIMSLYYGDNFVGQTDLTGKDYAFSYLFYYCSKLVDAKNLILSPTTLESNCYGCMFYNCTSLVTAPELPATTLAEYCYNAMFCNCTSLTTTPALPATTLAEYCYDNMFRNCTSLTTAPQLPATTLVSNCYNSMFRGCTSLTAASQLPATILASYCYQYMFFGCTSLVTAPSLLATTLAEYCYSNMFRGCTSLTTVSQLPASTLANYCYQFMFLGCTSLVTSPTLPATTLAEYCYDGMFRDCTNLTTAPQLPATTLASYCYNDMFYGCTSLVTAPALPATTLAGNCYRTMFRSCTSLTTAPQLPATTLVSYCYAGMFYQCTALTSAPELQATQLAGNCYRSMFNGCTALTSAPELPATSLANYCYRDMFKGCSNLNYIKALFTTTPSDSYTPDWVSGVAATGTFVKNSIAVWDVTGTNGVPSGWTVTTA